MKAGGGAKSPVGLGGTTDDGSVTLTPVDTWVQVPDSGNVPDKPYTLIITKEIETGTIRFSFNSGGSPSATNGNVFNVSVMTVDLAAHDYLFFGSDEATDIVNWTLKRIVR